MFSLKLKAGQLFMFDMIFSFVVLLVSFGLMFNYYASVQTNQDIYDLNRDILSGFSNTKINSLNDDSIRDLFRQNKIQNIENTVAQQVVEFYSTNQTGLARDLTKIFVGNYLDKQMNFIISLKNDTMTDSYILYNISNRPSITFDSAEISAVSSRTIFTFRGLDGFYGPYEFEVRIWK